MFTCINCTLVLCIMHIGFTENAQKKQSKAYSLFRKQAQILSSSRSSKKVDGLCDRKRVSYDTVCLTWTVDKSLNCGKLGRKNPNVIALKRHFDSSHHTEDQSLKPRGQVWIKRLWFLLRFLCNLCHPQGQKAWALELAGPGGKSKLPEENQRLLGMLERKVSNYLDGSVVFVQTYEKDIWCTWEKFADCARELEDLIICFWAATALTGQTFAEFHLRFISAFRHFIF